MHFSSALLLAVGAGKVLADEACSPLHFIYGQLLRVFYLERII